VHVAGGKARSNEKSRQAQTMAAFSGQEAKLTLAELLAAAR
jgi:hypothetical protein